MNCYNSAKYLNEALDSVLAQTFTDWEVILWDNQSSDESATIFKSYNDKRFHYYWAPEHTVLGLGRNLAVEQARGEWIAFLDCDDIWLPEKLAKQIDIINEEDCGLGLVYGHMFIQVEEGSGSKTGWGKSMLDYNRDEKLIHLPEGNIFPELLKENFVPLLSSVIRRSAYWQIGGIDPVLKQAEDYDLFVKIAKDFRVRAVQEIVCLYRVHDSNLSHTQLKDGYREAIFIVNRYLPSYDARKGIRSHQNTYATAEMCKGDILAGLKRLLFHGAPLSLIHKAIKRGFNF